MVLLAHNPSENILSSSSWDDGQKHRMPSFSTPQILLMTLQPNIDSIEKSLALASQLINYRFLKILNVCNDNLF